MKLKVTRPLSIMGIMGFMSAVGCVVLFCFIPHGNWGKISEHVNQALVVEHTKSSSRREGSGSLSSFYALHHQPFTSAFSEDFPNDVTAPLKVSFASFMPCSSLSLKRPEVLLFPRGSESIRSRHEARDCQAPLVVRVLHKSLGSGLTKDSGVLSLLFLRGWSFSSR